MEDAAIIWGVLLVALALVLLFAEFFIPSGGLLGILASAALVGGIVLLFYHDTTVGLIGSIAALLALPFLIGLGLRLLPSTPFYKLLTLSERQQPQDTASGRKVSQNGTVTVGDAGTSVTELRPVGTCQINGQRVECLAERSIIQPGRPVRVIWADGMQVKVRETDA